MFIIKNKKIFLILSSVLVGLSLVALFVFGIKVGIDFKGGAIIEVEYISPRPSQEELVNSFKNSAFSGALVQPTGSSGYIIKTKDVSEAEHTEILGILSNQGSIQMREVGFNSIGPSVGRELTRKAVIAVVLVSLAIICFIAYAFRKVSKPVSSWRYGLIAIATLLHDVIIPVGLFTILSKYFGAELDTLFVVGVLTILGLSVSDTIVIFDRIRENLGKEPNPEKADFSEVVGRSLSQSFVRSIATSMTTILVLLALVFYGPDSTRYFAIMLTAGMFFGTYSSIFLASPLLVLSKDWQDKKSTK
jgi:preprotein translocase subunit SecF